MHLNYIEKFTEIDNYSHDVHIERSYKKVRTFVCRQLDTDFMKVYILHNPFESRVLHLKIERKKLKQW